MRKRQSGFTLIEIAIVLFIIGLLIFSVLKGATLVHEAKVRKTVQMVEDIRTASNLFYREQGRLAGDGLAGAAGLDGWIDPNTGTGIEPAQFRKELIHNRYLTGKETITGADKWRNPLGGEVWVECRTSPPPSR